MLTRTIVTRTVTVMRELSTITVISQTRYVESDQAGGRMLTDVQTFEHLADHEVADLVFSLVDSGLPGEEFVPQVEYTQHLLF